MQQQAVPAHAGGVDLSVPEKKKPENTGVPAHAGGVDLSYTTAQDMVRSSGPRPCGRGGFKPICCRELSQPIHVPAHAGGVDLSEFFEQLNLPDG